MGWSNAGYRSDQGGWYKNAVSGGGSPTFTYKDSGSDGNPGTTRTYSIDIGTASSDRLVIVAVMSGALTDPTSVTANGVTLTLDQAINNTASGGGGFVGIYSGLVSSGSGPQNIVVSGAGAFAEIGVSVWTATGLSSNTKKAGNGAFAVSASCNITTAAGDFVVAMSKGSSGNSSFASSTETPAVHNVDSSGPCATSADWGLTTTGVVTAGTFSVASTTNSSAVVAVSYR